MKYKCLVFDHDDTVVDSTLSIHYPSFQEYLDACRPGTTITYEQYLLKNFSPGFIEMCRQDYGMTDADLEIELGFWKNYVKTRIPRAFDGIRAIMERQLEAGGHIAVISHSFRANIERDYAANGLPVPEDIFGWDYPAEQRKPNPFPMKTILEKYRLRREEVLMIDDLKPGYDMAAACGVDFAAAGWAYDVPEIERFMRKNTPLYFKTVCELADYIGF